MRPMSSKLKRAIIKMPRHSEHKILHHIHKRHSVSKKTLFYMKEYGPKSHLIHEIIKDSMPVLLISVFLASIAGLALRSILDKLVLLIPLVIMIPALNDLIGEMGSVVSSKFTTGLFLGKIKSRFWQSGFLRNLLATEIKVALFSVLYLTLLALFLSVLQGFQLDLLFATKIIFVGIISSAIIMSVLFIISVIGGIKIFKAGEDPNNLLIPLSTSIADAITLVVVSLLAVLLF